MKSKLTKSFLRQVLLTCLVLAGISVFAQDRKLTGKVLNSAGIGVAGASVKGKVTGKTTVTDSIGNFSLNVSSNETSLTVNSIGFLIQ